MLTSERHIQANLAYTVENTHGTAAESIPARFFTVIIGTALTPAEKELAKKAGFRWIEASDKQKTVGTLRLENLKETPDETITQKNWGRTIHDTFVGIYRHSGILAGDITVEYPADATVEPCI